MLTCRDGKGGKLSCQASKMLYKPPGVVYIASYKEPLDNQIAGNSLFSSEIILKLDRNTVHVFYFLINMCPLWVPGVPLLVWVSARLHGLTVRSFYFYFFFYFYRCFGGFGGEIVETARHVHSGWQLCCFWLWCSDLI